MFRALEVGISQFLFGILMLCEIFTCCGKNSSNSIVASETDFYLPYQNVKDFSTKIKKHKHLKRLHILYAGISGFPAIVGSLTLLELLDASFNNLTAFPDSIANLTKLQTLNLSDNKVGSIPELIKNLVSLKTLYLHNNQLSSIPDSIGKLTNLETLNLGSNPLKSLPSTITSLKKLHNLRLNDTQLDSIPEFIYNFPNLQNLNLDGNKLESLPKSAEPLSRSPNFKFLSLCRNPLKYVGEGLTLGMRELRRIFGCRVGLTIEHRPVGKITEFQAINNMEKNKIYWNICELKEYQLSPLREYTLDEVNVFEILDNKRICGNFKIRHMNSNDSSQEAEHNASDLIKHYIKRLSQGKGVLDEFIVKEEYFGEAKNLLCYIMEKAQKYVNDEETHAIIKRLLEIVAEVSLNCPDNQIRDLRSVCFILSILSNYEQNQECRNVRNIILKFIKHCISSEKLIALNVVTTPLDYSESRYSQYESRIDLDYILGFSTGSMQKGCIVDDGKPLYSSRGKLLDAFFTKFTVDNVTEIIEKQFEKYDSVFKMISNDKRAVKRDEILKCLTDELKVAIQRPEDKIGS